MLLLLTFALLWKAIKNSAESMPPKATLTTISMIKLKKVIQFGLLNIIQNVHILDHMECGKDHLQEELMA